MADAKAALDGARQILMERFAEDADLVGRLREHLQEKGVLISKVAPEKTEAGAKFADYFDYQEPLAEIPSHRALALLRGRPPRRNRSRFLRRRRRQNPRHRRPNGRQRPHLRL